MTTVATPAGTGFWQRNRIWFAVAAALLVAVAITAWSRSGGPAYGDPLDPENPGPRGGQAVAQVLAEQGVDVTVARSAADLADADPDAGTSVVVTGSQRLSPSTTDHLLETAGGARLVLVEPTHAVGGRLSDDGTRARVEPDGVPARCAAYDGLRLTTDEALAWRDVDGCFTIGGAAVLRNVDPAGGGEAVLFGAGQALTNDQVLRGDNAAVALRLLGASDRLVWYVPSYDDATADEATGLADLVPDWIVPGLWLGLAAGVALVLWRFRRLGPLSSEPLPVVVRAVETARSRGRMYHRSNDRGHAARALRAASRRRIAEQLRLGRNPGEDAVITAAHHQTGLPRAELAQLLASTAPAPATDEELVRLADALTDLDDRVTRR